MIPPLYWFGNTVCKALSNTVLFCKISSSIFKHYTVLFCEIICRKFSSQDPTRDGEVVVSELIIAAGVVNMPFGELVFSYFDDKNRGSE